MPENFELSPKQNKEEPEYDFLPLEQSLKPGDAKDFLTALEKSNSIDDFERKEEALKKEKTEPYDDKKRKKLARFSIMSS